MNNITDFECTFWPDTWFGVSITDCCIMHDLYKSNIDLFYCVSNMGGWQFSILAAVMFVGVLILRPIYRIIIKGKRK